MTGLTSVDAILSFAIREEEKANKLYLQLAEQVEMPHLKQAFEEMAAEEAKHKEYLLNFKEGDVLRPSAEQIQNLGIAEMMREVEASPNLDYQQILIFAMQREKAAFQMYTALSQIAEDEKLRLTLEALAQEEAKHKLRIEVEYDQTILTEG